MRSARTRTAAAVLCLSASLLGCSEDDKSTPPAPAPFLDITASVSSVVANGTSTVTLSVIDTGGGPVFITTTRGTFTGAVQSATVDGASGTLTLTTCDSLASPSCAGTAVINASSATGSDSVSVTFGSLATLCPTNCAADPGCATAACNLPAGGSGTCSGTTPSTCVAAPACTATETPEATCGDGVDNDCDGDVDCADADCADQVCDASPTFLCQSGACTDTTSGLAIEVTPARTRLPAVAGASTAVTARVTSAGEPVEGMGISISATGGTPSATSGTTLADGTVTFTLAIPGAAGVATVTASITSVPLIADTATVTVPRLGSFQLPSNPGPVQFSIMGARDSGWNELGWIQVQVLDELGNPYPDGLPVRFEHRVLGGSTLGPPLTGDVGACTAPTCVGYQGATSSGSGAQDSAGLASVYLHSGRVAGTLAVTASTTADGVTRTVALPTAAVVGAKASGTNLSIVCSPRNVPALAETDCAVSLVDAPFSCEALLKDRFNNVLGRETQVIFASEAGAVGQVTSTPGWTDPAAAPPADLGVAVQTISTLGAGLPFDVPAATLEPVVDLGAPDRCGVRFHNPRDGAVTVMALADGEEGFFDANGNGVYDATPVAEPFVDQGEPFVDQDDSGDWEPGEWFLDLDGDGAYDLPNGSWDASTKVWTQTVVVYTGTPATLASGAGFVGTRWAAASSFTAACTETPAPAFPVAFALDAGTPSESFVVVASDQNLNMLHTGTTYGVAVKDGETMTAAYQGLESYADLLGFFYRYWPCADPADPATCASQCRATGACVMTPSVTDFSCGVAAGVVLERGSTPDGSVYVDWRVDVPWEVYGGSRVAHSTDRLSGTSN